MRARTLSAGVIVTRRGRFLLLRAYGYWDFPKGEVGAGEEPLAAAIREVAEETSITGLCFDWGDAHCETPPYGKGKVARYYLASSPTERVVLGVNPALGRPEHHEHRWLTYAEAREKLVDRLKPVLDWAAQLIGRC